MKFVIVGAGALGSIYAAYLARSEHQVSLIARGERAVALATHGISVEGKDSFSVHCDIVTQPETLKQADVVIVAVKTYDTDAALEPLRGLKADSVFSVQNGVLKNKQLSDVFGPQSTLGAIGMLGGEVLPAKGSLPGVVRYNMPGTTIIGEPAGGSSARVKQITDTMSEAGLDTRSSDDITAAEWSKFVGWSAVSALAILTRLETWRFLVDADTALIAARILRETANVATRHGISLPDSGFSKKEFVSSSEEDAVAAFQARGRQQETSAPTFRQSILQDADRNRRLEVNETLGYTLTLATELGVPTPTLDLCCRMLRVVSRSAG